MCQRRPSAQTFMLLAESKWLFNKYTIHLDRIELKLVSIANDVDMSGGTNDVVHDAQLC